MKERQMMKIAIIVVIGVFLGACHATTTREHRNISGTLMGCGAGALAGSQIGSNTGKLVAVAIGTIIGCGVGDHLTK